MPPETPLTTTDGTQLDPKVLKVMSAIRQTESDGNYGAIGDGGDSKGAFQYNDKSGPGWKNIAKEHLGDENAPMDKANQNKATYFRIKKWKDEGRQPEEIAALWNGATKNSKTGLYEYNNPEYGAKFRSALLGSSASHSPLASTSSASATPTPTTPAPAEDGLGSRLAKRGSELIGDIGSIASGKDETGTQQSRVSGLIQAAGGIAGAVGDVVGSALGLIPGVKQVEKFIGIQAGKLAETQAGQAVMNSMKEFYEKHPELSKNAGAIFNIATAIPIFKGLRTVGSAALDGASVALKNLAEKGATKELTALLGKTKSGYQLISKNPEVVKTIVDKRLLPDIEGGVYRTAGATNSAWESITGINEKVGSILGNAKYANTTGGGGKIVYNTLKEFPNSKFTYDTVMENARKLTPKNGLLWDKFEAGQATLKEINLLRSNLDEAVKSVYQTMTRPPLEKELGSALAGSMRNFVKTTAKETAPLFDDMSKLFDAQKALKFIEGKTVKGGLVSGVIKDIGMAGGEMAGSAIGVPIAGAFAGRGATGLIERQLGRVAPRVLRGKILNRTAEGAVRQAPEKIAGRVKGLVGAGLVNRATRQ